MEEKKVRKKTTTAKVRNKWNEAHYDRITATLPKGYGDMFKEYCADRNTTMNATISAIIKMELEAWKRK